ncbi:MAG TPA: hypothetical protein VGR30_21110 [Candidatus Binatia bacterium]|jgi:hypothetical protein|nr:hypothetical protein [Candidatus Binatia bacterium]
MICRPLILLLVLCVPTIISISSIRIQAAELPTIEVGLPEDGLFGLGGQYIVKAWIERTALS